MTKKLKIFVGMWQVLVAAPLSLIYGYKLLSCIHAPYSLWAMFWICTLSSLVYGVILGLLAE